MNTGEKAIVPYTMLNIKKCMCPQCPVQADSNCVKEKLESLKRELEGAREVDVPEPQKVPGIYCSTGKAPCQDLNYGRGCICNTCTVWKEYNLQNVKPVMYFCQKGKAT